MIGVYEEELRYGGEIVELRELLFKEEIEYNEEGKEVVGEEEVGEVMG